MLFRQIKFKKTLLIEKRASPSVQVACRKLYQINPNFISLNISKYIRIVAFICWRLHPSNPSAQTEFEVLKSSDHLGVESSFQTYSTTLKRSKSLCLLSSGYWSFQSSRQNNQTFNLFGCYTPRGSKSYIHFIPFSSSFSTTSFLCELIVKILNKN